MQIPCHASGAAFLRGFWPAGRMQRTNVAHGYAPLLQYGAATLLVLNWPLTPNPQRPTPSPWSLPYGF